MLLKRSSPMAARSRRRKATANPIASPSSAYPRRRWRALGHPAGLSAGFRNHGSPRRRQAEQIPARRRTRSCRAISLLAGPASKEDRGMPTASRAIWSRPPLASVVEVGRSIFRGRSRSRRRSSAAFRSRNRRGAARERSQARALFEALPILSRALSRRCGRPCAVRAASEGARGCLADRRSSSVRQHERVSCAGFSRRCRGAPCPLAAAARQLSRLGRLRPREAAAKLGLDGDPTSEPLEARSHVPGPRSHTTGRGFRDTKSASATWVRMRRQRGADAVSARRARRRASEFSRAESELVGIAIFFRIAVGRAQSRHTGSPFWIDTPRICNLSFARRSSAATGLSKRNKLVDRRGKPGFGCASRSHTPADRRALDGVADGPVVVSCPATSVNITEPMSSARSALPEDGDQAVVSQLAQVFAPSPAPPRRAHRGAQRR